MTDVLILHRIPGGRPGQILPLDERLQNHVDAGNARILPNASQPPVAPPVLTGSGFPQEYLDEDTDEDTD